MGHQSKRLRHFMNEAEKRTRDFELGKTVEVRLSHLSLGCGKRAFPEMRPHEDRRVIAQDFGEYEGQRMVAMMMAAISTLDGRSASNMVTRLVMTASEYKEAPQFGSYLEHSVAYRCTCRDPRCKFVVAGFLYAIAWDDRKESWTGLISTVRADCVQQEIEVNLSDVRPVTIDTKEPNGF